MTSQAIPDTMDVPVFRGDGHEPPVHARAGRRALQLAHAAIASWEQGVRIPTTPEELA